MKTIFKIIGTLMLTIIFVGCSSVKVTDSWKDAKTSEIKNKNILVLNRTNDNIIRTRFESDITELLNKKGYKSLESYKIFPTLKPEETLSNEQLMHFKKELSDIGIDVIIMTILKDVNEFTKTTTTEENVYIVNMYPTLYYRGYNRGFYRPHGTIYIDSNPLITTMTSKSYVLETFIYDLTQPKNNQLLSVITSVIDDPKTLTTTTKDFSRKLMKELSK